VASDPGVNERPIIIIKRVKKVAGGHHGGAWKVAYADFVTAMMAFFMLLWLISNPDKEQLKGLAEYFTPSPPTPSASAGMSPGVDGQGRGARRGQSDRNASKGQPGVEAATAGAAHGGSAAVPNASMRVLAEELRVALDAVDAENRQDVEVQPSRDGVRVSLMDTANRSMFRSGTAELNDYGKSVLAKVAARIAPVRVQLAVEGHTDGAGQVDANWRLSGDRADAARAALVAGGVPQDRFTEIVALGSSRPVYPDQPERPENRRITIVLLAELSALPSDASFRF
jgi:chemotaxis protein MotB